MIRPLRSAHRAAFSALAVLLPALLASAWKVRPERPVQALVDALQPGPTPAAGAALDDVLVYWSASPQKGEGLPADAELVGSLRSGALARTPPAGRRVVGYSLAHGRVVTLEPWR